MVICSVTTSDTMFGIPDPFKVVGDTLNGVSQAGADFAQNNPVGKYISDNILQPIVVAGGAFAQTGPGQTINNQVLIPIYNKGMEVGNGQVSNNIQNGIDNITKPFTDAAEGAKDALDKLASLPDKLMELFKSGGRVLLIMLGIVLVIIIALFGWMVYRGSNR